MDATTEFTVYLLEPGGCDEASRAADKLWVVLSARVSRHELVPAGTIASCACSRFWVSTDDDVQDLRRRAHGFEANFDIAILPASRELKPRLIAFDLDSTLINVEVIDELAKVAGVGEQVAQLTAAAMRGEIDFQQAFRQRIAMLKGLDEQHCLRLLDRVGLTEGAEHLIRTLHARGCKVAVLSGGFTFIADWLKRRLPLDFTLTNKLAFRDGRVTGEVVEPIIDAAAKAKAFRGFAEAKGIPLEQTIAVGDGANDVPMMKLAGLSVAFRAKPKVREQADVALSRVGLDGILHLIAAV